MLSDREPQTEAEDDAEDLQEETQERELRVELRDRLSELADFWSEQYDQMRDDAAFASGDQWSREMLAKRKKRPCVTLNITKPYIDRIVNPLRLNNYHLSLTHSDESTNEVIQGYMRAVERGCNFGEANERGLEDAVTGGLGWLLVRTEYKSQDGLEQRIVVDSPTDPTTVFLDPWSTQVDGSDADYGVVVRYLSKRKAEEMYGDDVCETFEGVNLYDGWTVPSESVADLVYYRRKSKRVPRYYHADGSYTSEPDQFSVGVRDVVETAVEVIRFVGSKMMDKTELPIRWVPIVPVQGDRVRLASGNIRFAGLVHKVRQNNILVNYYASNEQELVALAPKSPWVAAEGQIKGYEKIWATANTNSHDVLPYIPTSIGGVAVPPPFRADSSAQTQGLIQSKDSAISQMARLTGMVDTMFGGMQGANQSGRSVMLTQSQGELSTAQYMDNLSRADKQVGRIIAQLIPVVHTGPEVLTVYDADGVASQVQFDLSTIDPEEIDVSVESGPGFESRRREAVAAMLEIGTMMPDAMPLVADILVSNLDAPGSKEVAKRLKKMLPPELQDDVEAPDPQALQALQVAEQTIQEQQQQIQLLYGQMQQLQSALIDNAKDRDTDLKLQQMKSETSLAQTAMQQQGENDRTSAEIQADTVQEIAKLAAKGVESAPVAPRQFAPLVAGPQSIDQSAAINALAQIKAVAGTDQNLADTTA